MSASEQLSMSVEDIIKKYPNDIPMQQIADILNTINAKDQYGQDIVSSNYNKPQLIAILKDNERNIEEHFGINIEEAKRQLEEDAVFEQKKRDNINPDTLPEDEVLEVTNDTPELDEKTTKLIDELASNDSDVEELSQSEIQRELDTIDKLDKLEEVGTGIVRQWQVRYIGRHGRISHGTTSTITGSAYEFHRDTWVDVEEQDFKQKYYPKVKNALLNRNQPQWEVRAVTLTQQIINFFVETTKKVLNIKPQELKDVKHVTSDRLNILHQYEIFSIYELLRTPKNRLVEILGADRGTVADMLSHAKSGLE